MEIPNIFWRYFDNYRRGVISIEEYQSKTGLSKMQIETFLKEISEN